VKVSVNVVAAVATPPLLAVMVTVPLSLSPPVCVQLQVPSPLSVSVPCEAVIVSVSSASSLNTPLLFAAVPSSVVIASDACDTNVGATSRNVTSNVVLVVATPPLLAVMVTVPLSVSSPVCVQLQI